MPLKLAAGTEAGASNIDAPGVADGVSSAGGYIHKYLCSVMHNTPRILPNVAKMPTAHLLCLFIH